MLFWTRHLCFQDVLLCHSDEYKPFTTGGNKNNLSTWEKDDTIFNNCSIHPLWFASEICKSYLYVSLGWLASYMLPIANLSEVFA